MLLAFRKGEVDLMLVKGIWYLAVVCDVPDPNWAFHHLRQCITYKARLAGIPVIAVDPRHTSQTCPLCGHVAKANRKNQAEFSCLQCGYAASADLVAARNIQARALVNAPMVAVPRQCSLALA